MIVQMAGHELVLLFFNIIITFLQAKTCMALEI